MDVHRRGWFTRMLSGAIALGSAPLLARAARGANVAGLHDQLEKGLRARLPAERAFVTKVVALVQADILPNQMVRETFKYAKDKLPYPFPYFERALRLRAAKIGVSL